MKKDYMDDFEYEMASERLNNIGNILLTCGIIMAIIGLVMCFGYNRIGLFILTVIGVALIGFGSQAKMLGNSRKINAYLMKSQIPALKDAAEELSSVIKDNNSSDEDNLD